MNRFDKRNLDEFKKDIKFGTKIEKLLIQLFEKEMILNGYKIDIEDYGTDNDGEYQSKPNTKADYKIHFQIAKEVYSFITDVKFCPTKGKATFKVADLQNYIRQNASMLLIYNNSSVSLKKPKNHDLTLHTIKIIQNIKNLSWGFINTESIKLMLDSYPHKPIPYMGNKLGIVVPEQDFKKICKLEPFRKL